MKVKISYELDCGLYFAKIVDRNGYTKVIACGDNFEDAKSRLITKLLKNKNAIAIPPDEEVEVGIGDAEQL